MERPKNISDFTAAILAGGKNTRFSGKNKAKMIINGRPLIERTIDVLQAVFNDIIIITNNKDEFGKYKHIRIAGDIYHNIGPLGGLHSALRNTDKEVVFIVASDMPGLSIDTIRYIVRNFEETRCEVLIPRYQGHIEPLHAIYTRQILGRLEDFIKSERNYSIREFLKLVDDKYLVIEDKGSSRSPFLNINRPEDLPDGAGIRST